MPRAPEMLDALLAVCKTPADVASLYSELLQRVINHSPDAEMDAHLATAAPAPTAATVSSPRPSMAGSARLTSTPRATATAASKRYSSRSVRFG